MGRISAVHSFNNQFQDGSIKYQVFVTCEHPVTFESGWSSIAYIPALHASSNRYGITSRQFLGAWILLPPDSLSLQTIVLAAGYELPHQILHLGVFILNLGLSPMELREGFTQKIRMSNYFQMLCFLS